jgi:hypothetical protein
VQAVRLKAYDDTDEFDTIQRRLSCIVNADPQDGTIPPLAGVLADLVLELRASSAP